MNAGNRAPQVPADTQKVNMEMLVKGILTADSRQGEEAEISTPTGRLLKGRLIAENPPYTHNYGEPISELGAIGRELRAMLKEKEELR
ncbi:MAG TPA: 2-amino-4-ketopentanoate thiolase [Spirochaeta sp.]|nr:2-amino-4-ketopentanoate thiolase [Spirochaeta sp.]